jgi:predicted nucleic acid-binding protein
MTYKPSILIDLNIILDVVQQRKPFYEPSALVLDTLTQEEIKGYLAAHTVTTLFYLVTRLQNRQTASIIMAELLDSCTVAAVDDSIIRIALTWGWSDFEDAVQMAAAIVANVDYIVTRNKKDFAVGPIAALTPGELLALLATSAD